MLGIERGTLCDLIEEAASYRRNPILSAMLSSRTGFTLPGLEGLFFHQASSLPRWLVTVERHKAEHWT